MSSRAGWAEEIEGVEQQRLANLQRGAVQSAIKGKRGQAFLTEMIAALDALPAKRLAKQTFEEDGEFCALGAVARSRGMQDITLLSIYSIRDVAAAFNASLALTAEIIDENDDMSPHKETREARWVRMRTWAARRIEAKQNASTQKDATTTGKKS